MRDPGVDSVRITPEPCFTMWCDMPLEAADDGVAGGLIVPHDGSPFFGIQPLRPHIRANHVTEPPRPGIGDDTLLRRGEPLP